MQTLEIKDLIVEVAGKRIIKGLFLTINKGDVLALVGPNGHGKSSLLNALMGNPDYHIISGSVKLDGEDLLALSPDERAKKGLFMAFQNPPEIEGVTSLDYYKQAINSKREKPISLLEYYRALEKGYEAVKLDPEMKSRSLNLGFSGGEKKRNEILQMLLLKPSLVFLDEIDSGLDADALKLIYKNVQKMKDEVGSTFVVISHYDKLYELLVPNKTAIIINGVVALTGDGDLALRVAKEGYDFLRREYDIAIEREKSDASILETCAVKKVYDQKK